MCARQPSCLTLRPITLSVDERQTSSAANMIIESAEPRPRSKSTTRTPHQHRQHIEALDRPPSSSRTPCEIVNSNHPQNEKHELTLEGSAA